MATATANDTVEALDGLFDGLFDVVVLDDPHTPFDLVTEALVAVCGHPYAVAMQLTWRVHSEGSAVVAVESLGRAEEIASALIERGLKALVVPL